MHGTMNGCNTLYLSNVTKTEKWWMSKWAIQHGPSDSLGAEYSRHRKSPTGRFPAPKHVAAFFKRSLTNILTLANDCSSAWLTGNCINAGCWQKRGALTKPSNAPLFWRCDVNLMKLTLTLEQPWTRPFKSDWRVERKKKCPWKAAKEKMEIANSFRRSQLMGSPCQACYVVKSDDFFDVNWQCQNTSVEVTRSSAMRLAYKSKTWDRIKSPSMSECSPLTEKKEQSSQKHSRLVAWVSIIQAVLQVWHPRLSHLLYNRLLTQMFFCFFLEYSNQAAPGLLRTLNESALRRQGLSYLVELTVLHNES